MFYGRRCELTFDKKIVFTSAVLFLLVFGVYVRTLDPVFHADDSPETISCSYTLGIQHPPGYPLPTLIGKIFTFIPAGNIGFRVNLQAAFFGGLAAVFIFLAILDILRKKEYDIIAAFAASASASICFAFSATFWSQALSAKGGIYTFNAFLMALLMYLMFLWERKRENRYFYLFSFTLGLSAANHWESMIVAVPAFCFFILLVLAENKYFLKVKPVSAVYAALFFIPGILLYAYLVIRANSGADLDWGNPVNLKQLLWVITRAEYTHLEKAADMTVILKQCFRILKLLIYEFSIAGFIVFLYGIYSFFKSGKIKRLVLIGTLFATVILSLSFYLNLKDEMIWVMDVFIIPAYLAMAFILGAGIYGVIILVKKYYSSKVMVYAVAGAAFLLPLWNVMVNFGKCRQDKYYYAYDFGMNIIKSVDRDGGMALLEGDYAVMPQMYFKYVDKRLNFCPVTTLFLSTDWGQVNLKRECPYIATINEPQANFTQKIQDLIAMNYKDRDIYTSIFRQAFQDFYKAGDNFMVPNGVLMKLSTDRLVTLKHAEVNFRKICYRGLVPKNPDMDSSTKFCISNYASAYMEAGSAYRNMAMDQKAIWFFQRAIALAPEQNLAEAYTHLGIEYSTLKDYDSAIKAYRTALAIKPKLIEAHSNLAGIYNILKDYDKSIQESKAAIDIKPDFSEAYNNLAIAYFYKGDKQAAIDALEKAISIDPGNQMATNNLMIIKGQKK